jgi:sugar phosphate isomerase/epimerase
MAAAAYAARSGPAAVPSLGVNHDPDFPGPRLICSTAAFFARPLAVAFGRIAEAGFAGVEVMVTRDPETQEGHRLRELAAEHDLEIRAIHAPFLLMTRKVWGTDPIGKIYRSIELAEQVGAPLVTVHPPYRWQVAYRRWLEDRLPELSLHTGVVVAVENMFPIGLRGRGGLSLHAKHELEDLEQFPNVVLDTSHAAVSGLDLLETFDRLAHRIAHVHLSNNAGRGWDSHLPLHQGVLPIESFLDRLATEGFAGSISLELDLRPYLDDEEALREVLVGNRELCEASLALPA